MTFENLVVAFAIASAGCGLVKINGASSGAHAPTGGASPSGTSATGDVASVTAAYHKFTFDACTGFDCVGKFRKAAGVNQASDAGGYIIEFNPRAKGNNPDPAWLPGWDALPTKQAANDADVVYEALVSAAAAKTWQARCHADYATLHAKLALADQQAQAAIAAASAKPNISDRLAALVALRGSARVDDLGYEARLDKLVGGRYAIEMAILDAYRAAHREYLYFIIDGIAAPAAVVEHGRPRGELADERERYCAAALDGHVATTPKPDTWGSSYLAKGQAAVKSPVDRATVDKFDAMRTTIAADNKKHFTATRDYHALASKVGESSAVKGELARVVTETTVKTVKRSGNRLVVELANLHHNTAPYGCRQTGHLDSQGDLAVDCKQRDIYVDQHAVVTFDDVPSTTRVEPGDHLEFFGTKTGQVEKTLVDSVPVQKSKADWTFEGADLVHTWH